MGVLELVADPALFHLQMHLSAPSGVSQALSFSIPVAS
jgi:hypothetical protein